MRTNNLLTSTALTTSAVLASGAALAQSPPVYNWSGFYIGVNAGGGWAKVEEGLSIPGRLAYQASNRDSGFTGGGQLGYNWFIAPNWLFGIEGDFNYLKGTRQDTFGFVFNTGEDVVGRQETRLRWLNTVRGRFGYVWANTAFYATGGLAIGKVESEVSATRRDTGVALATFAGAYSSTRTGWTAGGGIEHFLSNRVSLKVEYLHFDLGDFNYNVNRATGPALPAVPSQWLANGKVTGDLVRFGMNYRFAP